MLPIHSYFRSAFLSGRLPIHVNIHNDDQSKPGAGIPPAMTTVADKLKGAGYRTHHVGKWHVVRGRILPPVSRHFCLASLMPRTHMHTHAHIYTSSSVWPAGQITPNRFASVACYLSQLNPTNNVTCPF